MRRKYGDCQRDDGDCTVCSLVSYGRDCHNKNISSVEWYRRGAGLEQQQLAEMSGVNVRQIRKIEAGEILAENLSAKNVLALSDALDVDPHLLLK